MALVQNPLISALLFVSIRALPFTYKLPVWGLLPCAQTGPATWHDGGLQPLQVDELELDWEWFNITVTMPCSMWQTLTVGGLPSIDKTAKLSPDTERIREALKQRVVCPKCHGTSTHVEIKDPCPRCGGAGTIPQTIPGARLYPRGEHLRVK